MVTVKRLTCSHSSRTLMSSVCYRILSPVVWLKIMRKHKGAISTVALEREGWGELEYNFWSLTVSIKENNCKLWSAKEVDQIALHLLWFKTVTIYINLFNIYFFLLVFLNILLFCYFLIWWKCCAVCVCLKERTFFLPIFLNNMVPSA